MLSPAQRSSARLHDPVIGFLALLCLLAPLWRSDKPRRCPCSSCHEALLSHVYCNGYCDVSLDLNIVSGQEFRFVRVYDPNTVAAFLPAHSVSLFRRGMHQAPKCQVMSYQVTLQLPAPASSFDKRFYPVTLCINPPICRGYESRSSWKLYRAHHYTTQQVCLGSGDSLLIDFFNVSYLT